MAIINNVASINISSINPSFHRAICQCDQCGEYSDPARDVSTASELARRNGWITAKASMRSGVPLIWLCPNCQGSK